MSNQQHPITPSDELVWKWHLEWCQLKVKDIGINEYMAAQASRWGADQQLQLDAEQITQAWQKGADAELEACCEWIHDWYGNGSQEVVGNLYADRRPKPPSLADLAIERLELAKKYVDVDPIRRALERLQELENNG